MGGDETGLFYSHYLLAVFQCPLTVHSVTEEVRWKVELGVRPEICRDSLVVGSRRGIRMYVTVLTCISFLY